MAKTFNYGAGIWATKEGSSMAYNDQNDNYKPTPFSVTRDSIATRVNKQGLIEVVGKDKLRIDYKDSSNGVALLEPSRTNYLPNSDNGSSYTTFSATKTLNEVISLDGTLNSFTLEGNGDYNQVLGESVSVTLPSAGDYTFSVFAKKGNNNFIQLFFNLFTGSSNGDAYFDLENGTTSSSFGRIEKYGNGWYKCSVVGTVVSGDLTGKFGFRVSYTSSNFFFPTANDAIGKNAHFYGFQLEQGSYATSYIPTSGSTYQRQSDVANGAGNEQVFNDSEGVLFAAIANISSSGGDGYVSISSGSALNRATIRFTSATNNLACQYVISGSNQTSMDNVLSDRTKFNKIAFKYKENDFAVWVNGFELSTDLIGSTLTSDTLNELSFDNGSGVANFYGKTKEIGVYDTVLTDAELEALTSYTSFTNMANELNLTIK
jgi:hypothetical protein